MLLIRLNGKTYTPNPLDIYTMSRNIWQKTQICEIMRYQISFNRVEQAVTTQKAMSQAFTNMPIEYGACFTHIPPTGTDDAHCGYIYIFDVMFSVDCRDTPKAFLLLQQQQKKYDTIHMRTEKWFVCDISDDEKRQVIF